MTNNENKKNSKKIILILILLILIIVMFGCLFKVKNVIDKNNSQSENSNVSNNDKEINDEEVNDNETITNITNLKYKISGNLLENFDLSFLQLKNEKSNKVYSPLSIKYALEMLGEGSNGNTKLQIDNVVGNYIPKKYTNNSNMSFANAFFIKDTYKNNVEKTFITNLNNKYNAEVIYDSFTTPSVINSWVKNKTFNLIDNLYDDINDMDFILINALAIDMEWVNKIQNENDFYSVNYPNEKFGISIQPFKYGGYRPIEFANSSKRVRTVEIGAAINKYDIVNELGENNIRQTVGKEYEKYLSEDPCGTASSEPNVNEYLDKYINDINSNYNKISSSTDFYFYDSNNAKAFAKDLKEYNGTTLQYIGIMPKNDSLENYIKNTDANKINEIINSLKEISLENFEDGVITEITGYIPMFKFEYELDLTTELKKLGIVDVFELGKADITGITNNKSSYISNAIHKSNVEFSNEGIKAAAATSMGGFGGAGCGFSYNYDVPVKKINLTFDSPYLFLIRDKESGEIWFIGTVYEPIEYMD